MTSPLQGGSRRGIGWDGPRLIGPRRRRRWPGRLVALGLSLLVALIAFLAVGADEAGEGPRVGGLAPPAPSAPPEQGSEPGRSGGDGAQAAVALGRGDKTAVDFEHPPEAGIMFDVDTGEVLWRRRPRDERPIASLTKVMTALLVAEQGDRPNKPVLIDRSTSGLDASGGVLGAAVGLEPGMRVKSGALFHAMLMASANDAATALAAEAAGSAGRFVEWMNRRARRLELDCTRFTSPHGLEPENRSCAADLAVLTRLAMEESRIPRVARKPRAVVDFPMPGGKRHLATTNPLLQTGYEGTIGLKTGFTAEAGSSLDAVVRRDGRTLAVILLDSPDAAGQAMRLFEAGFGGGKRGERKRAGRAQPKLNSERSAPPREDRPRPARREGT